MSKKYPVNSKYFHKNYLSYRYSDKNKSVIFPDIRLSTIDYRPKTIDKRLTTIDSGIKKPLNTPLGRLLELLRVDLVL
jgi:hypothetical protein